MGFGAESAKENVETIEKVIKKPKTKIKRLPEDDAAKLKREAPVDMGKRGAVTGAKKGTIPAGAKTTSGDRQVAREAFFEAKARVFEENLRKDVEDMARRGGRELPSDWDPSFDKDDYISRLKEREEADRRRDVREYGRLDVPRDSLSPTDAMEAPTADPYEAAKRKAFGNIGKGRIAPVSQKAKAQGLPGGSLNYGHPKGYRKK